ncbi:monovalent cation/H+ antiporter subunit E [Natronobeatus ordinarius]|uniref:monovalent cation/H+ antiporter subunit E n=1 Tax=Natronobeatus ordinarius TaxID=2963433 RepID=UPI0020CD3344|nr:monovalent cation/H+ antiporter subunit E [Natronobeatus ordinarius]
MADKRLLVPLSESVTVRQTVGYAVRTAMSESAELHFVVAVPYDGDVPGGQRDVEGGRRLLERALAWANEDADGSCPPIETAMLGRDELLFGPRDYAQAFAAYAEDYDVDRVILDPEFQPGVTAPMLQPLERELEAVSLEYEEARVERPARHERLVGTGSVDRYVATFGISLVFYLILGDPTYWFDLVTGVIVATIVSLTLAQVTFTVPPQKLQSPLRVIRFSLYVPYLVFEIVKANLAISLVILHPRMPIDPKMTRVNARVRSGLPLLALANSITLTPGTLTVRANDQRLVVHTLIASAREDLFEGSLERAIRFVFYGREAAATATPRERGDTEIIGGEES